MILATKNSESLPENIGGEGHSAAGWGIDGSVLCYSCRLHGLKSVHSGNGLPLLALRHLVTLPVSTLLRIM